ncbi:hypothetical protein VINI7043_21586 [Vibrio nigripulchritudo ATCC 27043]|uniref:hypothetical protein n=1 Tax=Vibrio nigripulchritudo TaxID=28173 RepID=UPI00021C1ECE|nr:hypothetical protein [Vibrio nigripulchritudo]EGU61763.1 hypothetical protein VINI7043_21586 [Vibrio nigripulchritudo ATCC 27043]
MKGFMILACSAVLFASTATASSIENYSESLDFAQVEKVKAVQNENGSWCFHTTVRHNDQGWDHYADEWQVIDLDGKVLGTRTLAHPHDNEQPFTRSKCGIKIPESVSKVAVRAKCNIHGYGGKPVVVNLNVSNGDGFTVRKFNQ